MKMTWVWIILGVVCLCGLLLAGSSYWYQSHLPEPPLDSWLDGISVAHTPPEAINKLSDIQGSLTKFISEISGSADDQHTLLVGDFYRNQWFPVADNATRIAIVSGDQSLITALVAAVNEDRKQFPDGTFSHVLIPLLQQRAVDVQAAISRLPVSDRADMTTHLQKIQVGWDIPSTPVSPPPPLLTPAPTDAPAGT